MNMSHVRSMLSAAVFVSLVTPALADVPPTGGSCTVTPPVGEANVTQFTLSCSDWTDADAELPLTYRFAFLDAGGAPIPLSGYSLEGDLLALLPQGADPLGVLPIIAVIRDTSGATTAAPITATVTGAVQDSIAAFASGLGAAVESELDAGNPGTVLELASTIGNDKEEAARADDLLRQQLADRASSLKARAKGLKIARKLVKKLRKTGVVVGDKCSFWDTTEDKWSTQGCRYAVEETITICTCTHL